MNSPANLDDVPEVNIYVDLNGSSELQPPFPASYNNGNGVHHAEASNSRHLQHKFDLNGPAQDVDHGAEVDMDSPVDAAVEEYTGSNFGTNNYKHSGEIDWNRGSIDVASDGILSYYESARKTEPQDREAFDMKAAVQEAQDRDEDYFQDRLEKIQSGGAHVQQQEEEYNFDMTFNVEDNYVPLWYHK